MKKLLLAALVFCFLLAGAWAAENDVVMTSYNYEPAPVEAGQTFELWIHVANNSGQNINDLTASSKFEYPFSLPVDEVNEQPLGALTPAGTALVHYEYIKVDPNTPSGEYKFDFKVGPQNGIGRNYSIKIKVTQKKPDIELIGAEFEPKLLNPGLEQGKAKLVLKNLGKTAAYDVKTSMDIPIEGPGMTGDMVAKYHVKPLGSPLSYLDKILPGEEKTVELNFSVDRDADLKTYLIPLKIDYKNENNAEFTLDRQIGAEVTDQADLDVVLVAVDPPAVLGSTSKVSMDVFNAGGATANYVVAEPASDEAEKIVPEKVFIGTLEPDDFDSLTFQLQAKADAKPGVHPIKVKLTYRDKGALKELPAKDIMVNFYTQAEANAMARQDLPLVPIAGGLLVLGFLFRNWLLKLVGLGRKAGGREA